MTSAERAKELLQKIDRAYRYFPGTLPAIEQEKLDILTAALDEAAKVPAGCVRDDKGVDRKVLGMLPITEDGAVVGVGATVWGGREDLPVEAREVIIFAESERGQWPVEWSYSTREAAQSAKEVSK